MIRRLLDFTIILVFVWICMIIGLWLISEVIVPLEISGIDDRFVEATLKVAVSAGLVLFWLWLWREIVKIMFWHTLKSGERKYRESGKQD